MIRELSEFEENKEGGIIYYELKPNKRILYTSPYSYCHAILDECYIAHNISSFPKIKEARILSEDENWYYGDYIKHINDDTYWFFGTEKDEITQISGSRYLYQGKIMPKWGTEPKILGIRPVLVIKQDGFENFKFKPGDLLFCSKRFEDPYREDRIFQQVYFFSFLSNNLLCCDECIGSIKYDPFLDDFFETNKKIDEWYTLFADYFSFEL